jgi:hypothetical protein
VAEPPRGWRFGVGLIVAGGLAIGVTGCSDSASSGAGSTETTAPTPTTIIDPVEPRADQIRPAIAALEAQLGSPQDYFEVNATARLVNLWVALNDGTQAQPWTYVDGELTSRPAEPAQGHTFTAEAVTFDEDTLFEPMHAQLPDSAIELLVIEGGAGGAVRYTVVAGSTGEGRLLVTVGPDGSVESVEAN